MAEFTGKCPFSGQENGWKETELEGGGWKGESVDGSYIVAEDREGLDREIGVITLVCNKVRDLVGTGTATDAGNAYYAQVKIVKDQESGFAKVINDLEGRYKLAEAAMLMEHGLEGQPTEEMLAIQKDLDESKGNLAAVRKRLDEDHPHFGRVLSELSGLAKKEREF